MIGPKAKTGCIFCLPADASAASGAGAAANDAVRSSVSDSLVVFEGRACYVILNRYPYNNGHVMVVPHRHESTLAGLSADEMNELGRLTQLSELALREAYRLDGINVGVNLGRDAGAGIVEHVHVHLVPRWNGDTNFMTTVAETRVLPEKLGDTAARLREIFDRLARG